MLYLRLKQLYWRTVFLSVFLITLMLLKTGLAQAQDRHIVSVPYQENQVIQVTASLFITTQICFNSKEHIETIQNGDASAWTLYVPRGHQYTVFLKPTQSDSKTNMTVITNQHTYYFKLISQTVDDKAEEVYAIQFSYPESRKAKVTEQADKKMLSFKKYNGDYSASGTPGLMPQRVYDDGQFTYLQFRFGQTLPAVFSVNTAQGEEALVNYRREGAKLIIHRVAPQLTLREGMHRVVSIFNNPLIQKITVSGEGGWMK